MARSIQITFDCADAPRLAAFWAEVLGYIEQPPPDGFDTWPAFLAANELPVPEDGAISAIVDPAGVGPRLLFLRVPEGKSAKNRVHLDIPAGEGRSAECRRLVDLGATHVRDVEADGEGWIVMLDPEGNEFCLT
jgi:catechol 2,3-dioxygenase-like lactoylglutathione lyase family enzyme